MQYFTSLLESYCTCPIVNVISIEKRKNRLCGFGSRREQHFGSQKNQTYARACDISPICLDAPTWAIAFVFGMHGNFADVITRDKFFVDLFRGFRVLRLPMFLFYIGLAGRSYDSVSTTVLYCNNESFLRANAYSLPRFYRKARKSYRSKVAVNWRRPFSFFSHAVNI